MIDDDYEIKFWTWGMREKYIDLSEITDTEEYYTEKIHDFFVDYNVNDPIYDYLFKK